jgi:hypothetical protein
MIVMLKNVRTEHWLTAGQSYTVLAIDGRSCRLIDDGGAPTLFAMTAFDVVDPTVAPQWEFRKGRGDTWRWRPLSFIALAILRTSSIVCQAVTAPSWLFRA